MNFNIINLVGLVLFAVGSISATDPAVGVSDAQIEQHNYIASFRLRNVHLCSGTIIAPKFILTTVHCTNRFYFQPKMEQTFYKGIRVYTGTSDKKATGSVHEIKTVHRHKKYTGPYEYLHNIALIELKEPITFSATQNQISISNDIQEAAIAEAIDWVRGSNQLKKAKMYIMTDEECHEDTEFDILIYNQRFCVTNKNENFRLETIMSGTPLILNGKLIAIDSCIGTHCTHGLNNVYTNVYSYKDWILNITSETAGVKFDYTQEHIGVIPQKSKA